MYVIKKSLSSVVVLTTFLLSTSAFAMNTKFSDLSEEVRGLAVRRTTDLEISSVHKFSNPVLQKVYNISQAFIDFENDNLEKNNVTNIITKEAEKYIQQNIVCGEFCKSLAITCDQKTMEPCEFLEKLLEARLKYLDHRAIIISTVRSCLKQNIQKNIPLYGPTHPDDYNKLSENLKFLARTSTDRYQLINQTILYVWEMINPRELPSNVKTLVRCSTTLWPNLTGERDYLGHPDEAILDYDGENFPYDKDRRLYGDHIEEFNIPCLLRNWTNPTHTIKTTRYLRSLCDDKFEGYGKIKELPYPDWLKLVDKPSAITIERVTAPTSADRQYEKPTESTQPAAMPAPQVTVSAPTQQQNIISASTLQKPIDSTQSAFVAVQYVNEPVLNQQTVGPIQLTSIQEVAESEQQMIVSTSTLQKSIKFAQLAAISTHQVTVSSPIQQQIGLPAQQQIFSGNKYSSLKKGIQTKIDSIFDYQGYNSITFGEFKNVWHRLHGEKSIIENTGSSHKRLISSDGQVFPIFAHGDGMRYTKNTIKYLRDALRETGYSPK